MAVHWASIVTSLVDEPTSPQAEPPRGRGTKRPRGKYCPLNTDMLMTAVSDPFTRRTGALAWGCTLDMASCRISHLHKCGYIRRHATLSRHWEFTDEGRSYAAEASVRINNAR